jgi:hypothetical protein
MRRADNNRVNMAKALERSLDMLGEPSKRAPLFHLMHTFKIPIDWKECSLEEIEEALKKILGEGASLVVASINNELKQETG